CASHSTLHSFPTRRSSDLLRVDIHCHYLNAAVAEKVAHLNPAQHEPSAVFANAQTREVNVKQMRDRGPKLTDIALRLKDMDKMRSEEHTSELQSPYDLVCR